MIQSQRYFLLIPSGSHLHPSVLMLTMSNMFTHCRPLRKAAYTSSSLSGWGVLAGGSLVEPVNILLPYSIHYFKIKKC